jgi:hypothetical protein
VDVTKDDLKTLQQLPRVLAVLRKLANEAEELASLAERLKLAPQAGPSASAAKRAPSRGLDVDPAPQPEEAMVPPPIFPCPLCGEATRSPAELDAHLADLHPGTNEAKNADVRLERQAYLEASRGQRSAMVAKLKE